MKWIRWYDIFIVLVFLHVFRTNKCMSYIRNILKMMPYESPCLKVKSWISLAIPWNERSFFQKMLGVFFFFFLSLFFFNWCWFVFLTGCCFLCSLYLKVMSLCWVTIAITALTLITGKFWNPKQKLFILPCWKCWKVLILKLEQPRSAT